MPPGCGIDSRRSRVTTRGCRVTRRFSCVPARVATLSLGTPPMTNKGRQSGSTREVSMRFTLASLFLFLIAPAYGADDVPAPTGGLVAKGAKLELLFTRTAKIKGGLTEGPAVAPDG